MATDCVSGVHSSVAGTNSPRWSEGTVEAVDLNSWLVLDAQKLPKLHRSSTSPEQRWLRGGVCIANTTAALTCMQQCLWNETAGVCFDRNPATNASVSVITPATFFALLPGVATQAQAERMALQLNNTLTLRTPFPFPVVSRSAPTFAPSTYWRGPVWINIKCIVIVGLRRYGLTSLAAQLQRETLGLVARIDVEHYNSVALTDPGSELKILCGLEHCSVRLHLMMILLRH